MAGAGTLQRVRYRYRGKTKSQTNVMETNGKVEPLTRVEEGECCEVKFVESQGEESLSGRKQ